MLKNYLTMKKNEWKIKAILYRNIAAFLAEKEGILELLQNLYANLKNVPAEELQEAFIDKLAAVIHNEHQAAGHRP